MVGKGSMNLIHHDTTGTQTDSARSLSRKKLKRLMPQYQPGRVIGESLDSKGLSAKFGRRIGHKLWPKAWQKREERHRLRRLYTPRTLDDGTNIQLVPTPAEVETMKPTLFERLGGLFGNMTKRFQRKQAMGK